MLVAAVTVAGPLTGAAITTTTAASATPASAASPAQAPTAAPTAAGRVGAHRNALTVVAGETGDRMWFHVKGKPHAGRVAVRFVNRGDATHEATLLRLKKGVSLATFKQALSQGEEAAGKLIVNPDGEITGPALIGPGVRETAYVRLHAGHYAVVCFLPGPDGQPHVMMGMIDDLRIARPAKHVAAPRSRGTVRLTDHHIVLPRGFAHGGTFKVVNTGKRPHDFTVARLDGKTSLMQMFGCVGQSFATGTPIDRCPGTLHGGVTTLAPGHAAYLRLKLSKGHYGYLSSEGNDVQRGLQGTFTVR